MPVLQLALPRPHLTAVYAFLTVSTDVKGNIDAFLDEIEHTKWLSRQQIEITNMGSDFVPPRIVVSRDPRLNITIPAVM